MSYTSKNVHRLHVCPHVCTYVLTAQAQVFRAPSTMFDLVPLRFIPHACCSNPVIIYPISRQVGGQTKETYSQPNFFSGHAAFKCPA